ncbi:MAG TPA: serine/threonine-protein kinase, partial [Polyangiaceae bacterium]
MPTKLAISGAGIELERRLGRGASGSVWLGRDRNGTEVAVKIASDGGERARFALEAERLVAVSSPHIVRLLDAGVLEEPIDLAEGTLAAGLPFLVLEAAGGTPLSERFGTPRDSTELALSVARDIGGALEELHAAGFTHGDVKPENIVVSGSDGQGFHARLVDFGLSGDAEDAEVSGGTWRYLAPELAQGGDARARDVWALGLTLAEIVSARVRGSANPIELLATEPWPKAASELISAALRAPGTRPSAAWLHRRAFFELRGDEGGNAERERRRRAVQSSYLTVRHSELLEAATFDIQVAGAPLDWLRERVRLRERIAALASQGTLNERLPRHHTLRELDDFGRSQWLSRLIGPQAASFGVLTIRGDAELAERLLALCDVSPPESWTLPAIERGAPDAASHQADSAVGLALSLGAGRADGALLARAEQFVRERDVPEELVLALGRALRLRGELGRALLVFEGSASVWGRLEAAETARRAGDVQRAEGLLAEVASAAVDPAARARRAATLARIRLSAGAPEHALSLVADAPETAATLEARALAELALGARSAAASSLERAESLASAPEEHARLCAVGGALAHAAGDAELALGRFRSAAAHAAQAGAVLEEASYLTGVAAAATTTGDLADALRASRRSILLFEALGRPSEAARAALARANAFLAAGAFDEARDAATDA